MILDAAADIAADISGDCWADPETPRELDALVAVVVSLLDAEAGEWVREAYADSVAEYQAEWRDYDDCPLDGDHDSAMTSIGWGTDEDYGYYGDDGGYGDW
jgi:hypothetical protein